MSSDSPKLPAATNPARLHELRSYAILDTAPEPMFDELVQIASYVCQTPMSLLSFVDRDRQWFKAEIGVGARQTPIEQAVCAHAIEQPGLFEVSDTTLDARFADNPLVTGELGMRFYAGAPLVTPSGRRLGTICVLDRRPRELDEAQRQILLALSRQAMRLLETRTALRASERAQGHLRRLMTATGHDLKQPLQMIMTALDVARLKSREPLVATTLQHGVAAAARLGLELDELAIAASMTAQMLTPRLEPVSIAQQFGELARRWRPLAVQKGLQLDFAPCSAQVYSHPVMLQSMLGNLIGNAIKYTRQGRILVGARRESGGTHLRLMVLDTGIGIEAAKQAAMFDLYGKVDPGSEGLGLGLGIVRDAAEALGHDLRLRSAFGRGTAVSLTLLRVHP